MLEGELESSVTLIYGNRDTASIMFRERLSDLKDRYLGRLSVIHLLSRRTTRRVEFSSLDFRADGTPEPESWQRVVKAIDTYYRQRDQIQSAVREGMDVSARFANLFRSSPIPMMEQDYSDLERLMEDRRAEGVTDIRTWMGDDVESVRRVVPLITITAANPAASPEATALNMEATNRLMNERFDRVS